MQDKPIFVVFGATGAQGGSVVSAFLDCDRLCSQYRIRAVCRDTSKPAAELLKAKGVEVVSANLSFEPEIRVALSGAQVIFLVTDYNGNACDPRLEFQQGKVVADVAKDIGVHHLIFSSLFSVSEYTSHSIRGANEFDSKAKIEEHIRKLDIPATFVFAGFYMSLFEPGQYLARSREVEGNLELELPVSAEDSQFPLIDTPRDFGKFVISAMLKRDSLLGAKVYAAEGYYTLNQIADIVNRLEPSTGQRCHIKELSDEEFLGLTPHSGTSAQERQIERLNMYQFLRQFGYYGGASLDSSHKILDQPLRTFEEFVSSNPEFRH
ncbi:hscarg protein [Ilyonectria destructans]|nr:hscarg protein [Ilyonectria destructans]